MNTRLNSSGTMNGFLALLVTLVLLAAIVMPASAIGLSGSDVTASATGETVEYPITLDEAPAGLAGYSMTVTLTNPSVGTITSVTFPSWATLKNNGTLPADTVTLKAADLSDSVPAGSTGITLATLKIRADTAGSTPVKVTIKQMDDDTGGVMSPAIVDGSFTVEGSVTPTPTTTVIVPPEAAFFAAPVSGTTPLSVQFTDLSTGNGISAWAWDFNNDGSVDITEQNPLYTYTTAGSYSVKLVVTGTGGNGQTVKTDLITVTDAPTPTPTATQPPDHTVPVITAEVAGSSVVMNWQKITDSDLSGYKVVLSKGNANPVYPADGYMHWITNPDTTTVTISAGDAYNGGDFGGAVVAGDTYYFSITAVYNDGSKVPGNVVRLTVPGTVTPTPTTTTPPGPTADFTGAPRDGTAPLSVQFTDLSTGNGISAWAWDFNNDGSVESTEQNPLYTYTTAGTYSVKLTVTDADGNGQKVHADYIAVTDAPTPTPTATTPPGPTADFTGAPRDGTAPLSVQFTDLSTGNGISAWAWDFNNDGSVESTEQNPLYTYTTSGTYSVKLTVTDANGNGQKVHADYIAVTDAPTPTPTTTKIPPPVADFAANQTSGEAPLAVQFTDLSTGEYTSIYWDFNADYRPDSYEKNPVYVYTRAGTYTVQMAVIGPGGQDYEIKSGYITVTEPSVAPVAGFSGTPTSGDAPLTVQFTDESTGSITAYAWDFENDGSIDSTEQNPSHVYTAAGTYDVNLTVTGPGGSDSENRVSYIAVSEPAVAPVAGFSGTPTSGDALLTVQFTDESTGSITAYAWDFENDGSIDSTEQNPSHVYTAAGTYDVNLTVMGPGGSDSEARSSYITVSEPLAKPVANFTADPLQGTVPLEVQFTDTSAGTGITEWKWDFESDGSIDNVEQNPKHIFTAPGVYSITLTVKNAAGSDTKTIASLITVSGKAPVAQFSAIPLSGSAPLKVVFTDESTDAVSYAWDFENDGIIDSTEQNPEHIYAAAGSYTVNLTVANPAASASEVRSGYITVAQKAPSAEFEANATTATAPMSVQFTDLSTGDAITAWAWDFENDGTVDSTDENPGHVYSQPGVYNVSLMVTNSGGSDTEIKEAYIRVLVPAPVANFTANQTSGYAPLSVWFTDASTGTVASYAWDFQNDGTIDSTEKSPVYTYASAGNYTVNLTVANAGGSSTALKPEFIQVQKVPAPVVDFTANLTTGLAPLAVQFTDASTGVGLISWSWDFNNDNIVDSTEQNPAYTFRNPGTYSISLAVKGTGGTTRITKTNYITVSAAPPAAPKAEFEAKPTSGKAPLTVKFTDKSCGKNITTWAWDFNGDGVTDSTLQNPSYTYTAKGSYTVKLTVKNAGGSDTRTKKDYIKVSQLEKPDADFKADKQSGKAPLTVKFMDKSRGEEITAWTWDFNNDGLVDSTEKNPTYTYANPGKYTVKLVVTNAAGSDMEVRSDYISVTGTTTVVKKPIAVIQASKTWGTPPMTVKFIDKSLNKPTSRTWFFGDGTSSIEKNPKHLYADPGIYFARLYVENSAGTDQDYRFIFVLPKWFPMFWNNGADSTSGESIEEQIESVEDMES